MKKSILGLIRHVLTFGGGYVVSQTGMDADPAAFAGAAVTAIGFAWSAIDKWTDDAPAGGSTGGSAGGA